MRLTLVSASPRRRELLTRLGWPFDIEPSGAAERWLAPDLRALATLNARRKVARSALYGDRSRVLLGADTIVVLGRRVFGKPAGPESAARMLSALSGRPHQVITGVILSGPAPEANGDLVEFADACVSIVRFRELTSTAVDAYLASGEWEGKAGAYAIQGVGRSLVAGLDGDFDNVVGLPVQLIHERIRQYFSHCRFL